MKRSLFVSLIACLFILTIGMARAAESVPVDAEHFPDDNFRSYVLKNLDIDQDGALSEQEINSVTVMMVGQSSISSLKGVEYFTGLTQLYCQRNQLTSLDVSGLTKLEVLGCENNQLTTLDVSELTNLTLLRCSNNRLTSLDVSMLAKLRKLYCGVNKLTTLNVAGLPELTDLSCENNQLTSLEVSKLTSLKGLYCLNNQLTSLEVSELTNLTELSCENNQLTSLEVSKLTRLTSLFFDGNQLTSVNTANLSELILLTCADNQLTSLNIANMPCLIQLSCEGNQLTSLDVSTTPNMKNAVTRGDKTYTKEGSTEYVFENEEGDLILLTADPDVRFVTISSDPDNTAYAPAALVRIDDEAFRESVIECYRIGEKVTHIGAYAFANMKNPAIIYMPAGEITIADTAFEGSSVTFVCASDSPAAKWAEAHGIPVTAE